MGLFDKFKQGLKKTSQLLKTDIRDLLKHEGELVDDVFLDRLMEVLIHTDMGPKSAREIVSHTRDELRGRVVKMDEVLGGVKAKFKELLAQPEQPVQLVDSGPTVIMICGVNGSGKTTSIAKLTHLFLADNRSVVLGAADTFRAAAVEQLTVWSERLGARLVKGPPGSDPASVAFGAVKAALEDNADVCIIDTAGRLQSQKNLMDELGKIHRVIGKQIPEAPHEVLLVLDATAGQNGISQASGFSEAATCTGIILAKLDGTAKGGIVVAIREQLNIPVKLIGVGETPDDVEPFEPGQFVEAMFAS